MELTRRITPARTFASLGLPDVVRKQLRGVAVPDASSSGPRAVVLSGAPEETGAAAEAMAHDVGKSLLRVDLAAVVSKYIGETEKNLDRVFEAAQQSGALLLFDEADALFCSRSDVHPTSEAGGDPEVKDSHDRYGDIDVNYLLQRDPDNQPQRALFTGAAAGYRGYAGPEVSKPLMRGL
jgi:hypothetical protein